MARFTWSSCWTGRRAYFTAFLATGKTQEVPASRLRTLSRTQQILRSEVLVEDSAGSLELSLPALSSYQYVHGILNRETLEVSERRLRSSARGAKLEKQKKKGGTKTRGFRFLRPWAPTSAPGGCVPGEVNFFN